MGAGETVMQDVISLTDVLKNLAGIVEPVDSDQKLRELLRGLYD